MPPAPRLFTFDIFGTVLDWSRGLSEALAVHGAALGPGDFDRVIDAQAVAEQREPGRRYAAIVADSLVEVLGVAPGVAAGIGADVGRWPLFADAPRGLQRLQALAPCAAMTNSDRVHGEQVQVQLGFRLSHWLCAEALGCYKPARAVWTQTAAALGVEPDARWWHVSAYADYDLEVARALGLTTVLVERPHCRRGAADVVVPDLLALAERVA